MTPIHEADGARELAPDDVVGNALCDALLESPDPSIVRVLNAHGEWCESAPSAQDYVRTLERVPSVVARFPGPDDGLALFVCAKDGIRWFWEGDHPAMHRPAESIVESRGQPELVLREDALLGGGADE